MMPDETKNLETFRVDAVSRVAGAYTRPLSSST